MEAVLVQHGPLKLSPVMLLDYFVTAGLFMQRFIGRSTGKDCPVRDGVMTQVPFGLMVSNVLKGKD